MNKEKFNELCKEAGFVLFKRGSDRIKICPPELDYIDDDLNDELNKFKNLLLDEVIKELNALSSRLSLFGFDQTFGLQSGIEIIEGMK